MNKETLKYQPKIALKNYGIVFAMMAFVAVFLVGRESPNLVILKLAVVPLVFLAVKGVNSIYVKPIYEHKVTLRAFECSVLQAIVISLAFGIVTWEPHDSLEKIIKGALIYFTVMFVLHMYQMVKQVNEKSKEKE